MRVYEQNLKRFDSIDYRQVTGVNLEQTIGYKDPDECDRELYVQLSAKYGLQQAGRYLVDKVGDQQIRLKADALVGCKELAKIADSNAEWKHLYSCVQSDLRLRFLWPVHHVPTINTMRKAKFNDRIDLLLLDLKRYFNNESCVRQSVYNRDMTCVWLTKFDSFDDFVNQMKLRRFVDKDHHVIDLVTMTVFDDNADLERLRYNTRLNSVMKRYVYNLVLG